MKVSKTLLVAAFLALVTLSLPFNSAEAQTTAKKKHHGKKASHSQTHKKSKSKSKKKKAAKKPAKAAAPAPEAAPEVAPIPPGEPGAAE